MLLVFVGGGRVEGIPSDICVSATANVKKKFPCVLSKEENSDKKVGSVAENTDYVFLSILVNPTILVGVLSDRVRHLYKLRLRIIL